MRLFKIDYHKLIRMLLPVRLRQPVLLAWLMVLLSPVMYVYRRFSAFRNDSLYYAGHTSQVVYMQAVLNDVFDSERRRIVIVDSAAMAPLYVYQDEEVTPLYAYLESENKPLELPVIQETVTTDFSVLVPGDVIFTEKYMRALIDRYRLASKYNYLIKIV